MNRTSIFLNFVLAAGLVPAAVSSAQSGDGKSPATGTRAVLVELFTSEGCSSCPPADEFLRQVNGHTTPSGMLIVGLSEHVTYWDSGGWKDPYSAAVYTSRQDSYASRFGLDSVYTPQAVVNGQAQMVGSDRKAILKAIDNGGQASNLAVHIASAQISGKTLTIRYSVTGDASSPKADIYAVVAADAAPSKVLRGENSGQSLAHAAVARSIERIATVGGDVAEKTAQITLAGELPPSPSLHLVLFAQAKGQGKILSVETTPLK